MASASFLRRMLGIMDADTSGATVAMGTPDASALPRQAITVVYTDGACLRNPGPGGWAWAVPGGRFTSERRSGRPTSAWRSRPCWMR
jgi:hypothetical protein